MFARELAINVLNYKDGITRKKTDDKFIYYHINTKKKVAKKTLERINKLGIPPAWENVWIPKDKNAKIQAIGYDVKGRKQYRYHNKHIENSVKDKYLRLSKFINKIPKFNKVLKKHSKLNDYDQKKVISTMLTIVKHLHMRVGKECYVKSNKSYGISSLRKKHVKLNKNKITFKFKGKSNKHLTYKLENKQIANHISKLLNLPNDMLFQYKKNNKLYSVDHIKLNRYIHKYMGKGFSCKDFRTYAANYHFVKSLLKETKKNKPKLKKNIKKNILNAIETTAKYLKHTKAISKKSYIMAFAINEYNDNVNFFINRVNSDVDKVIIQLLKNYKKSIRT